MSEMTAFDLIAAGTSEPDGNSQVTVSIEPVVGTGPTQLGMFNISVTPNSSTYKLINVQFIVQIEGQGPQQFSAFILIEGAPILAIAGNGYKANSFYASTDAVTANRAGKSLTVMVVGAVDSPANPFFFHPTFTQSPGKS